MDITLFPQHWASILCICIMVGAILIAYIRKIMITYSLIIANIVIFIITLVFENQILGGAGNIGLGFRPVYLSVEYSPQVYTLFTSMFIHAGFAHIFGNMFVFFFLGIAFEERVGAKNFLIIYLISGLCGTLTHSLLNLESIVPLVGASGAIFGIMGAFAFSYPRDEVVMPVPIGIMIITRIKVIYAVIIFAIMETVIVMFDVQDSTAHFAHLGGLIGGVILAALLIKRKKARDGVSFQTTYYDPYAPPERDKTGISNLRKLATTKELNEMLDRIEKETVPQVREIWLDHFLEKTMCPQCKRTLSHFDKKIWCENCGFKTDY
jgi:membrane associated rhomboid family serine protease